MVRPCLSHWIFRSSMLLLLDGCASSTLWMISSSILGWIVVICSPKKIVVICSPKKKRATSSCPWLLLLELLGCQMPLVSILETLVGNVHVRSLAFDQVLGTFQVVFVGDECSNPSVECSSFVVPNSEMWYTKMSIGFNFTF